MQCTVTSAKLDQMVAMQDLPSATCTSVEHDKTRCREDKRDESDSLQMTWGR